jgi:hypothetical protein
VSRRHDNALTLGMGLALAFIFYRAFALLLGIILGGVFLMTEGYRWKWPARALVIGALTILFLLLGFLILSEA